MRVKLRCVNAISDVRRLRVRSFSFRYDRAVSDEALHFECGRAVSDVSALFQTWGSERALWMRRFRMSAVSGGGAMCGADGKLCVQAIK